MPAEEHRTPGRKKNPGAYEAYVFTRPSTSLPPSGMKHRAAMAVAKYP
ncbi:hypothetical protein [Streptomyces scabiei]|nr:hypothetical protein [Streptomyces scabiei]MDX3516994.1 hypothetical protein [Streptomyces scabiei]